MAISKTNLLGRLNQAAHSASTATLRKNPNPNRYSLATPSILAARDHASELVRLSRQTFGAKVPGSVLDAIRSARANQLKPGEFDRVFKIEAKKREEDRKKTEAEKAYTFWKNQDVDFRKLEPKQRLQILEAFALSRFYKGQDDNLYWNEEGVDPEVLTSTDVEKFWGEKWVEDVANATVDLYPESNLLMLVATGRWNQLFWEAKRDLWKIEHPNQTHLEVLGIEHPRESVVTFFHIGSNPVSGCYTNELREGMKYGNARYQNALVWAIDVPILNLHQVMGGEKGAFESYLIQLSTHISYSEYTHPEYGSQIVPTTELAIDPLNYGLRCIGRAYTDGTVHFEGEHGDPATVYGAIYTPDTYGVPYLETYEYAQLHDGKLPTNKQKELMILDGMILKVVPDWNDPFKT